MHKVTFVSRDRYSYTVKIDDALVEFTMRNNGLYNSDREGFGISGISKLVDDIEYRIKEFLPLGDMVEVANGTNMFRILNALFKDETKAFWEQEYKKSYLQNEGAKRCFARCFGFVHSKCGPSNPLRDWMFDYARDFKVENQRMEDPSSQKALSIPKAMCSKAKKYSLLTNEYQKVINDILEAEAKDGPYHVMLINTDNNVFTYSINGKNWSVCLSGRDELNSSWTVLTYIKKLDECIKKRSLESLRSINSIIGGTASVELVGLLFDCEFKSWIQDIMRERTLANREITGPASLLKEIFGASRTTYYLELLTFLEKELPALEKYLIQSSIDEIMCDKSEWKLYYSSINGRFKSKRISFCEHNYSSILVNEIQTYLRFKARPYIIAGNSFAKYIDALWYGISFCLDTVLRIHNKLTSIKSLNTYDVLYIQTYCSQKSVLDYSTWRIYMIRFRAFYKYFAFSSSTSSERQANAFAGTCFPAATINPTKPASTLSLNTVSESIIKAQAYIRLAYDLYMITGGRGNSICGLTVDDLIENGMGDYAVRVSSFKTEIARLKTGKETVVTHQLPQQVAEELLEYISQTDYLRKQLDKPYIFVYMPENLRSGSKRKPLVLDAHTFVYQISKLFEGKQLYDEQGLPLHLTIKQIRAEVGRRLFREGSTKSQVSLKLGNTPEIASQHYNTQYPLDEAKMFNDLYTITIEPNLTNETQTEQNPASGLREMYGQCFSPQKCQNNNDCRNCPQRLVCKDKDKE